MGKIKTKKTLSKRVKITKSGKILKKKVNTGHLKRKWSADQKHRKKQITKQENAGHRKMFKNMLGKKGKDI